MLFFPTSWRIGACVLALCVAQGFSQSPVPQTTAPAPADNSSAAPATGAPVAPTPAPSAENKAATPVIPGLTTLPTSQAGPPPTPANQPTPPPAGLQINSGDLLDISVYGVPDLTQRVRVGNSGDAYFPLLGSVHLDGLTIEDAQSAIEKKLVDGAIMKSPHVTIFVAEYSSGVSMLGMIQRPGIYPLLGTRHLYDMISAAGGLSSGAGRLINVTHRSDPGNPLVLTLTSDPKLSAQNNIEIKQGDTVEVSKAGVVYVVGEVGHASGLIMDNGQNLSVMKAVALSGGTTRVAALDSAKIIRKDDKGNPVEVPVQLKKMFQGKAPDVDLVAEDILFIPTSAGKNAALRGAETALQLITGVTLRHF
jgi:polysaccharide export outer membrane protein